MAYLDYDSHLSLIEFHVGQAFKHPSTISYKPFYLQIGDATKSSGNVAGAYFNFKPFMYSLDPQFAADLENFFSKQGTLFISNLRFPGPWVKTGMNAVITYDYRCILCSGKMGWYSPPPPYAEEEPCHDIFKSLKKDKGLNDIVAFRRKSDGVLVMAEDWSWMTLGEEVEVEALYKKETTEQPRGSRPRQSRSSNTELFSKKHIEYL